MNFRLVAYTPFGSSLKSLPKPISVDIVTTLNDIHSLNLSYPTGQTNIENLWNKETQQQSEVSLEFFNEATKKWEEPLGCRFILMKHNHDAVEELPIEKFTMLSNKWLFRKAKVWDDHTDKDTDGRQVYREMTIGKMLRLLLTYAYNRGWLLGNPTNLGFTDTHDSGGIAWRGTHTRAFEPTMSLDAVMADLVEQGIIDWDIQGRKIMVFQEGTPTGLARNNRAIELMNVDDVTSSPEETSFDNVMTVARVIGDKNLSWVFENGSSSPFGRMEDVVSQAGVTDPITAREVTEKILEEGKKPRKTHTKEFAGSSKVQPFRDIRVGDWVTAHTRDLRGSFKPEEMRIQVISLKIDADGYTWNVDLGDKQADALARIAKKQRSLNNGASAGTSVPGTGGQTSGDWRIPTAPYGVSVIASTHFDEDAKVYKGRWVVNWSDDGLGTDPYTQEKSPQRRSAYELEYRVKGTTQWIPKSVLPESNRQAIIYPIDVLNPTTKKPYEYEIRMRTKGLEDYSAYSSVVPVTMVPDTTPPGVPAINVVSDKGVFTITWPGTFTDGSSVPSDFRSIKVEVANTTTGPWRDLGSIYDPTGGVLTLSGVPSGEARYFRAWSTDRSGNPSTYSPIVDAIGTTLVDIQNISNDILNQVADDLSELDTELKRAFGDQIKEATDQTLIDAATNAQVHYDELAQAALDAMNEAKSKTSPEYILSRGTDLVTNGTGYMGDNTNFSTYKFNPADAPPGARGSFVYTTGVTTNDELIPISTDNRYQLRYYIRQTTPGIISSHYGYLAPHDAQGQLISTSHYMFRGGTTTTLARPLSPGDTKIWLTSTANYTPSGTVQPYWRRLIFWNWTDPAGRTWPEKTYSRDVTSNDLWLSNADVNHTENSITLAKPWAGGSYEAGHPVSQSSAGGNFMYITGQRVPVTESWTEWSGATEKGTLVQPDAPGGNGVAALGKFPPGTAAVKVGWIFNYDLNNPTGLVSKPAVGAVSLSDSTLAIDEAERAIEKALEAAQAADAAQESADLAHQTAGDAANLAESAMDRANSRQVSFIQASAPTNPVIGDIWFDSDDDNRMYRYDGPTAGWVDMQAELYDTIADSISKASTTYFGPTAPATPVTGDLWFDSANGNVLKRYNGTTWVNTTDASFAENLLALTDVQNQLDNKVQTYAQSTAPTGLKDPENVGDIWFDIDDNKIYRWNGASAGWVPYQDREIDSIRTLAQAKTTTYFGTTQPTGTSAVPLVVGDLWLDSTGGKNVIKRYTGSGWVVFEDQRFASYLTQMENIEDQVDKKIRTFAQPTAPTGLVLPDDEGDLWFDTSTSGKNVVKRYNSSGQWVPLQDQALLDAAKSAMPKIYHSTAVASGTAPEGSTWFQHSGSINGPVIGQWTMTSNGWLKQEIASEVIANLDVGKLTAGGADISTLVANKLFANIFAANKVTAREMIISPGNLFPDPEFQDPLKYGQWDVVGGGLEKNGTGSQSGQYFRNQTMFDVTGGKEYVLTATRTDVTGSTGTLAIYAERLTNGTWTSAWRIGEFLTAGTESFSFTAPEGTTKVSLGFFTQGSVPSTTRVRLSDITIVGKTETIHIANGAITADKITASSEMMTALLSAKKIEAEDVEVGSFWANQAWLGAAGASSLTLRQIIGDLVTEVSGSGLTVSQRIVEADDSETFHPIISVGGAGSNSFTTRDPVTGEALASIGADGSIVGQSFDVSTDPTVLGTPIIGSIATHHDFGDFAESYIDGLPWGQVAFTQRNDHSVKHSGGELGILELDFKAQPGRTYRISAETGGLVGNGEVYRGIIRRVTAGSGEFTNSSFKQAQTNWSGAGQHSLIIEGLTEGPADLTSDPYHYRLLLSVQNSSGIEWINDNWAKRAWMSVQDVGPRRGNTGTNRSVWLSRTDNTTPTEPAPVVVTKRTASWSGTYMRSYYSGGIQQTGQGATMLKQGRDPYWTAGGLQSSMFLLNKSNITSTLAGSSVNKATLTVRSAYSAGGTSRLIRLYWHGNTSLASSVSSDNYIGEYWIGDGATLVINLPSAVRTALRAGSVGGFAFSPAGNNDKKYALGLSWSTRPKLTVEYTR